MTYISSVLADLPAGGSFWKGDEASGSLADSGSGAHAAAAVNTPTYRNAGPLQNETSYALGFQSADTDGFNAGDIFEFPGLQAYTIEFWLNYNSGADASSPFIISQYTVGAPAEGWNIRLLPTGTLRMQRFQGGVSDSISVTGLSPATWYYFAAGFDASNMRIYQGQLTGSVLLAAGPIASAKSIQTNAAALVMGRYQGGGNGYDGLLALPAIYPSTQLSLTKLQAHLSAAQSAGQQQLRPDADLDATGWSPTPAWSVIDEATAGGDVISATSIS